MLQESLKLVRAKKCFKAISPVLLGHLEYLKGFISKTKITLLLNKSVSYKNYATLTPL